jgi:RimJ/RimL family protein N-acetyltransferase
MAASPRELRTERLQLAPVSAADRDALHAIWTEPRVRRFLWDDRVISIETVDEVIAKSTASFAAEGFGHYGLREAKTGLLIGSCGLYRATPAAEPELLYSLASAVWGRGHASEAARAVIAYAFEELGLARLFARADVPNRASVALMQRLGMRLVGEEDEGGLRLVRYMLARADWEGERS